VEGFAYPWNTNQFRYNCLVLSILYSHVQIWKVQSMKIQQITLKTALTCIICEYKMVTQRKHSQTYSRFSRQFLAFLYAYKWTVTAKRTHKSRWSSFIFYLFRFLVNSAGILQHSHFWFQNPRDTWPYFFVSWLWPYTPQCYLLFIYLFIYIILKELNRLSF
jgi:hypothetical protein